MAFAIESMSKEKPHGVQMHNISSEGMSSDVELQVVEKPISEKWMGTEADRNDMRMLGRVQVLRVSLLV